LTSRAEEIRAFDRRLADATLNRSVVEDKLGQLEAALQERDDHLTAHVQAHSTLTDQNDALVKAVRIRDQAIARADEKMKVAEDRIRFLEGEIKAAVQSGAQQLDDIKAALHHEQIERSVTEGALEASRKDNGRLMRELSMLQSRLGLGGSGP